MIKTFCKSCRAQVIWAITENKKWIPIDPEPVEDGNLYLDHSEGGCPNAIVVTKEDRGDYEPGDLFWKSHFATCPDAEKHRKQRSLFGEAS